MLYMLKLEPKCPHKFQNHLLGTSPPLGTCDFRAKQRSRKHRMRQGGAPEGIWDTEGRDSILSVTLNTYPLRPTLTHQPLLPRPLEAACAHTGCEQRGPGNPFWVWRLSPVHSRWGGRLTARAPLGRAMGRQGVRILPQSVPPPCPAPMGGAFSRILQFAFNCLGLCLKPCPERISCSQSIHTCLFRFQRRFIDCVPLGKCLLSSLSERTG